MQLANISLALFLRNYASQLPVFRSRRTLCHAKSRKGKYFLKLVSPSQQLFGLFTQRYLFPIGKRTRCVMRPNNAYEGDYALTARKQLVDKNQPCNPIHSMTSFFLLLFLETSSRMRGHHWLFITDKAANLNATSLRWALTKRKMGQNWPTRLCKTYFSDS